MSSGKRTILTPGGQDRLVWQESVRAFERLGHTVETWFAEDMTPERLGRLFARSPAHAGLKEHPSLFFCINFHGLDKYGEAAAMLRARDVPVAVWCVDNPWNLLSGLRTDFWKELHLFVSDPSFVPGLHAHGAERVAFLPLATDPDLFRPYPDPDPLAPGSPLVFVGHTAFPDRDRFFVGQSLPPAILSQALDWARSGQRTDFHWWLHHLCAETPEETPLWPGSAARRASLGADTCSLAWRVACLTAAAPLGLTIHGDAEWTAYFPPFACSTVPNIRPEVDYYTRLPSIYARSDISLNMMSFLLPEGLNQRHFDVWAAGGFCLMDNCPGLGLFPDELVAPVTFGRPEDIPGLVTHFMSDPMEKRRLSMAWRELILENHTYEQRAKSLLDAVFG